MIRQHWEVTTHHSPMPFPLSSTCCAVLIVLARISSDIDIMRHQGTNVTVQVGRWIRTTGHAAAPVALMPRMPSSAVDHWWPEAASRILRWPLPSASWGFATTASGVPGCLAYLSNEGGTRAIQRGLNLRYRTWTDDDKCTYYPLSIYLSIYLSIHLSIHLPTCLSVYLSMDLSI